LVSSPAARLTVQTSLQTGLSIIYSELFDFDGDEIYFAHAPSLVGKSFGAALLAYEKSALLGLRFAGGHIQLNPPMESGIAAGDQLIAISADDNTMQISDSKTIAVETKAIRPLLKAKKRQPIHTLVLGWNRRAPLMIAELNNYVPPASRVTVVAAMSVAAMESACPCEHPKNLAVTFQAGETTRRTVLEELQIDHYHHVLILSDSDRLDTQAADARTLLTLIQLRDLSEKLAHKLSITSEMLDSPPMADPMSDPMSDFAVDQQVSNQLRRPAVDSGAEPARVNKALNRFVGYSTIRHVRRQSCCHPYHSYLCDTTKRG